MSSSPATAQAGRREQGREREVMEICLHSGSPDVRGRLHKWLLKYDSSSLDCDHLRLSIRQEFSVLFVPVHWLQWQKKCDCGFADRDGTRQEAHSTPETTAVGPNADVTVINSTAQGVTLLFREPSLPAMQSPLQLQLESEFLRGLWGVKACSLQMCLKLHRNGG